jgi:hypothetical protein
MDNISNLFPLILIAVLGYFAWRYFKHGSLTGALLGGRIRRTVGEVKISSSMFSSSILRVGVLEAGDAIEPQVALTLVSKAALGASMVPIKLTNAQARELMALLKQATER